MYPNRSCSAEAARTAAVVRSVGCERTDGVVDGDGEDTVGELLLLSHRSQTDSSSSMATQRRCCSRRRKASEKMAPATIAPVTPPLLPSLFGPAERRGSTYAGPAPRLETRSDGILHGRISLHFRISHPHSTNSPSQARPPVAWTRPRVLHPRAPAPPRRRHLPVPWSSVGTCSAPQPATVTARASSRR